MQRVRVAALGLVVALLAAGCGARPAPPAADQLPQVAGTWEQLPKSPLTARGNTQAIWTGTEVIFWGGRVVDPKAEECPPNADCALPPPGPEAEEVAAYNPTTQTWRRLEGRLPSYGYPLWADGRVMDQSSAYDPRTGATTSWPTNNLLVYAQAQIIGSDLVVVGWDYTLGELNGVGQVAAASLDVTDPAAQWRQVQWPLPPPGAESLQTATDGHDLVVISRVQNPDICDEEQDCHRLLRFDPATATWTDLGRYEGVVQQLASAGGRVYATTLEGETSSAPSMQVIQINPTDGTSTTVGEAGSYGLLLVSPTGQVALTSGPDLQVLNGDGQWEQLPSVPDDPLSPAVVWAGDQLVVWGGAAVPGQLETTNSAVGWTFRPTP